MSHRGVIIASDGRGFVSPSCEAIEARCYVPQTLAVEKLKKASLNYSQLKFDCDRHILELTEEYNDHRQRTQTFYENFIREIKVMAKSQIDSQHAANCRIVDNINRDLKISVLEVERLRDQLTFVRLEHQVESRSLRTQISSANDREILLNRQALDETVRTSCTSTITELIAKIELTNTTSRYEEITRQQYQQHSCSIDSNMKDCDLLRSQLASAAEKEMTCILEHRIRVECCAVVKDLISQIELASISKEHECQLSVLVAHLADIRRTNSNLPSNGGATVVSDTQKHALLLIGCIGGGQARIFRERENVQMMADKGAEAESRIKSLESKISSDELLLAVESSRWIEESRSSTVSHSAVIDIMAEHHRKEVLHLVNVHGLRITHLTDVIAAQSEAAVTAAVEGALLNVISCIELLHRAETGPGKGLPCETVTVTVTPDKAGEGAEREGEDVQSREDGSINEERRSVAGPSDAEQLEVGRTKSLNNRMTDEVCLRDIINNVDRSGEESTSDQLKLPKCDVSSPSPLPIMIVRAADLLQSSTLNNSRNAVVVCCEISSDAIRLAAIETLEDAVYELQQGQQEAVRAAQASEEERNVLSNRLAALVKEKRTDVVRMYEASIVEFRDKETELQDAIRELHCERSKTTQKLEEFRDRASRAENEVREMDARENLRSNLSPNDDRVHLRAQLAKQREDILLKSKAVTAGWDAAASADGRLDLDVNRAFRQGRDGSSVEHCANMKALHLSLEAKESRITELLVKVNGMEDDVKCAEEGRRKAVEEMRTMRLDAMETIAMFGTGLCQDTDGAALEKELDSLKDLLNNSQEELVLVMESRDQLSSSLSTARQSIDLLQQLLSLEQSNSLSLFAQERVCYSVSDSSPTYIDDWLATIRTALAKGAVLGKNNRKDECFDMWVKTCDDTLSLLYGGAVHASLLEGLQQARILSLSGKRKDKGNAVLKKTMERLLVDLQLPHNRKAEEGASREQEREEALTVTTAAIECLQSRLSALLSHEVDLAALVRDPLVEAVSFVEGEERSVGSGSSSGLGTETPSSLLCRAKKAEALIQSLKSQMALFIGDRQAHERDDPKLDHSSAAVQLHSDPLRLADVSQMPNVAVTVRTDGNKITDTNMNMNPNPAEVRKLRRRVRDLEGQLSSQVAGDPGPGSDPHGFKLTSTAAEEKRLVREMKDAQSAHRKSQVTLEGRVRRAESALALSSASLPLLTAERDRLKGEMLLHKEQSVELDALRAKAKSSEIQHEESMLLQKQHDILTEQFKKESGLRKKYKNELEDLKGSIRVYARCRPMVTYEKERGCKQVIEFVDATSLKIQTGRGEKCFEMDTVFNQQSTQEEVFEDTRLLVESFMDGFNVCLFAYGQTGSGKTFTMTGSPSEPGLTPRTVREIFRLIGEKKHLDCKVTVYFVELYNDQLVDLLWLVDAKGKDRDVRGINSQPPHLDIKMDPNKMVFVKGAVIREVDSAESLMDAFSRGNAERHTGSTDMNAESSRSHSVLSIMVDGYDRNTKRTVRGKLSLVDLAGSERAEKTGGNAERLREGQSINKSLSALGDVMAALSDGGGKGKTFVPYRNNKLTQLMQDSLGGNAKTLMFVNFSPADYNADETATSLGFATRVKKVVNKASQSVESEEIVRLKAIIKHLQTKGGESESEEEEVGGEAAAIEK